MGRRTLGVFGSSLPTKKSKTITASDFLIGGLIGQFERHYKIAFETHNPEEVRDIFGDQLTSSYYGWDCVKAFWDNAVGVTAKLWVKSHVGFGTAYDAVTATAQPIDGSAAPTLRLDSAYQGELEFGTDGNKTGYTITNGARFTTACDGVPNTIDTFLILDSVAGIKVGDIIKCTHTGPAYVYKKITSIDESARKVNFSGGFGSAAFVDNDVVEVMGFRLRVYRKNSLGLVSEVETEMGKIWCTMEPEVTDFYVNTVFATNKWLLATDLASASVLNLSFPADVATVTYLASGASGTAPTTAAHWANDLTAFDSAPIRMIANCETTDSTIQKAIETYCRARWDNPKVIYNITSNQTKAQLKVIGNSYQRSDDVLGVITANWLGVTDPFATNVSLADDRSIPNVGAVMGVWIRTIGTKGIHYIPAVLDMSLFGINSIVGDTFTNDTDRTELSDAGINVIQEKTGYGIVVRNFFTPSITQEFSFGNGILMREYFKVSFVDSLASSENEPNNFARIKESKMAILQFFYRMWEVGSTGNVPSGETFGQSINSDGSSTKPIDHFQSQADLINNPQSAIDLGERNLDSWFTYPSPAGSIKIGVGFLLR